ncbi:MAG: CHAT domain-containing protein [Waterburya sp.]
MLETDFVHIKATIHESSSLALLAEPSNNYLVITDTCEASNVAKLISRQSLTNIFLTQNFSDQSLREGWLSELKTRPEALPQLIAQSIKNDNQDLVYLMIENLGVESDLPPVQISLDEFYTQLLDNSPEVPVLDADIVAPEHWSELSVITQKSKVVGIFNERNLYTDSWRGINRQGGGILESSPPQTSTPAAPGSTLQNPFIAHPRLTPISPVYAGALIDFQVGFSELPDAEADEQKRIRIKDAKPGETISVYVSIEGGQISGSSYATLSLDLESEHQFTAQIQADVKEVTIRASYSFRNKPVGTIVKTLPVAATEEEWRASTHTSIQEDGDLPLNDPSEMASIDVIFHIHKASSRTISWSAQVLKDIASVKKHEVEPISVPIEGEERFAKQVSELRQIYGDSGNDARDQLQGIGKSIAQLIPQPILDGVLTPLLKEKENPSIQIQTDMSFIPWELARLSPAQAGDRTGPAFLGEVAGISHWCDKASGIRAPDKLEIEHISAVAATSYAIKTNRQDLICAKEERDALKKKYRAQPVEAKQAEIDDWLDREPISGHLAHIALHGYSDAKQDTQGLVLGDGAILTPYRLTGEWFCCDQDPRFVMVFLNACQVGTAGEKLGRMAGFPGAMVSNGVGAFVAPLWEIQDDVARDVSKDFYQYVLEERLGVAEALRRIRSQTPPEKSITPWAYVLYGHPMLKLSCAEALQKVIQSNIKSKGSD